MKEEDYWKQFFKTGKVGDYLSYLEHKETIVSATEGEHFSAGSMQCYRNDIEGGTFRGI